MLHLLWWLWRSSRGIRTKALLNIVLGLAIVGTDFALIRATKMTIDTATGQGDRPLWAGCALLIGIGLGSVAIIFVRSRIGAILGLRNQNLIQKRVFARLMHSVWTGKEQFHSGDVTNRLIRDTNEITGVVTDTIPATICVVFRLVIAFLFLYHFDARLAISLTLISPLFLALSKVYARKMRRLAREIRRSESAIHSLMQESILHRMVLKTLEQSDGIVGRLEQRQGTLYEQVRSRTHFSSASNLVVTFGFTAGYLFTFIWGVHRLEAGTITYGTMLAFIQLVGQVQGPFRSITRYFPVIISALTAAERLEQLEDIALEPEEKNRFFNGSTGIRLRNVRYAYPDGQRDIIRNFSFDFTPGSATAITGETGAGKTTLIRLILALLSPREGNVDFYDMTGATSPASPATRCNLVYVPQGNTLFSGTIRDNMLLGDPQATEQDMTDALHLACADFVFDLPEGLDTVCGESGTGLSEGQAQRIAIARALLRRGNVLLLDEATSSLDTDTEQELIMNISTRAKEKGQTILFITHRHAVKEYCTQSLHLDRL
ncbi:MAG: ABC transporter ATP-binding protein/permease [Bacteroidaceae bacterium]|nr:ABC transporter ATP-binding protein/permease [Bacteroidaceae bacterium]